MKWNISKLLWALHAPSLKYSFHLVCFAASTLYYCSPPRRPSRNFSAILFANLSFCNFWSAIALLCLFLPSHSSLPPSLSSGFLWPKQGAQKVNGGDGERGWRAMMRRFMVLKSHTFFFLPWASQCQKFASKWNRVVLKAASGGIHSAILPCLNHIYDFEEGGREGGGSFHGASFNFIFHQKKKDSCMIY